MGVRRAGKQDVLQGILSQGPAGTEMTAYRQAELCRGHSLGREAAFPYLPHPEKVEEARRLHGLHNFHLLHGVCALAAAAVLSPPFHRRHSSPIAKWQFCPRGALTANMCTFLVPTLSHACHCCCQVALTATSSNLSTRLEHRQQAARRAAAGRSSSGGDCCPRCFMATAACAQ